MRPVCDVEPHVLVIPPLRFKRCIIGALGPGRITPVRSVLESIRRSEGSPFLNECQKRPGRAVVLMHLSPEGRRWTPT